MNDLDIFGKKDQMNGSDMFGIWNSENRVHKVLEEFPKCELRISGAHSEEFGVRSLELDDSRKAQEKSTNSEIQGGGRRSDGPT